MKRCKFCHPEEFGCRKLALEDTYWYLIVPKEIGTFGQVMLVVRKLTEDSRHVKDLTDSLLVRNRKRLTNIMQGINTVSCKVKRGLQDRKGRRVEKVYLVSQCESRTSHLHFHMYPRYQRDRKGSEFLYSCELNEARMQGIAENDALRRIRHGERLLRGHKMLIMMHRWSYSKSSKDDMICTNVRKLNAILPERKPA